MLGYPDQARRLSQAAFRYSNELNQVNLTVHVRVYAGAGFDELLRDVPAVRGHADVIVDLSRRHGLRYWLLNGLILRGWAMVQEAESAEGIGLMRHSATERAALGVGWYQIRYLCMLAESLLRLGRSQPGLRVIDEAEKLLARNEDRMWQAELARIQGELLRGGAPPAQVEARFERALDVARRQGAKSLELRAATSLAVSWRDRGLCREARELLAPIYGWFTEGLDTPDLRGARMLLESLT
jgi:predicted ATPase